MTKRQYAAAAIVVAWLAALAWHVRREYFGPPMLALAQGARGLAPGTHFFVVRMNDNAIGYASARFDTVPDGYVFEDQTVLDVPAMGNVQRATTMTRVELDAMLTLRSFEFVLRSAIGAFRVEGTLSEDSVLDLHIAAGGDEQRSRLQVPRGVLLDAVVPLRIAAAGELSVGNEFSVTVFDPSAMADRRITMRVAAADTFIVPDSVRWDEPTADWVITVYDTVPVWRLDQEFGGATVATWIDEDGQMVRAHSPLGFTIERTAFELARDEFDAARGQARLASGYGNVIESTAIASNVTIEDVALTPQLAVRLLDVDLTGFDLHGGRQELKGDTLIIRRELEASTRAGYALPYSGAGAAAAELESTPLIQANDPRIRSLAVRVTGGTTDPVAAARLLNDFVYETLRKEITLSVPSALQVLEGGRGDCNEHTVLYVALARAVGLPTRTAAGVVYIRGQFYYHAWPEVWLGEQWVAVDPTLGQYPADASHIRFIIGGLARQVELVRLIGRLRLEVV
jgi:hypothetical protein